MRKPKQDKQVNWVKLVGYVGGVSATITALIASSLSASGANREMVEVVSALAGALVTVGGVLLYFIHPYKIPNDEEPGS